MLFSFHCPQCDSVLEAEGSLAGSQTSCPQCGRAVAVPEGRVEAGTTLAGFRLDRLLGKGGMGEVYLARQLSVDRHVAVKILPSGFAEDAQAVKRFLQEGKLAAGLDHHNIATIFEAGDDEGHYYLAMAYVDGESLDRRLKRERVVPEAEALGIVRCVAEALAYAWDESQLVHRDIKPANIMLDRRGRVFLMDLGLARSIGGADGLTATGAVMGTPQYMSPEQARGEVEVGLSSDIYSLGATLYHLVVGAPPFVGRNMIDVLHQQINSALPPPRERNPELSEGCGRLIQTMMAKQPSGRFTDWGQLIAATDRVLAGGTPALCGPQLASASGATGVWGQSGPPEAGQPPEPPAAEPDPLAVSRSSRALHRAVAVAGVVFLSMLGVYVWRHRPAGDDGSRAAAVEQEMPPQLAAGLPVGKNGLAAQAPVGPVRGRNWAVPGIGMEFVWVKQLGFWVGKYEVTNREYRRRDLRHVSSNFGQYSLNGGRQPVSQVTWEDARSYADWLTGCSREAGHLPAGWHYRLPTEEEFVAYARCGDGRVYPWGNAYPPMPGQAGNYSDEDSAWRDKLEGYSDGQPSVGDVEKSWRNPWGLYGVGGNLWEACAVGAGEPQTLAAYRGGAWDNCDSRHLCVAARFPRQPTDRAANLGFRLVLAPSQMPPPRPAVAGRPVWDRILLPSTGSWALAFDGEDDRVDIPGLVLDSGAPLTIEAVVESRQTEGLGQVVCNAQHGGVALPFDESSRPWVRCWAERGGKGRRIDFRSPHTVVPGRLMHVAAAWNGSDMRLYVNGFAVGEPVPLSGMRSSPLPFVCGAKPVDGERFEQYFHGAIACVRVSKTARYTEDFALADVLPMRPDPDTLCLLDFEEGTGVLAEDSSGNGNHGQIHGATWTPLWPCPVPEEELRKVEDALRQANPKVDPLAVRVRGLPGGIGMALPSCPELTSIEPLRGLPLVDLTLDGTGVSDLSPLQGAPLKQLSISYTPLGDLSALKGCALVSLQARNSQVSDLSPLRGMPLRFLHLYNCCGVNDLAPLEGMRLAHLCITETGVLDLSVLRGMPLRSLGLGGSLLMQVDTSPLTYSPSLEILTHVSPRQAERLRDALPHACICVGGGWNAKYDSIWSQTVFGTVLPEVHAEIWSPPPRRAAGLRPDSEVVRLLLAGQAEKALAEWGERGAELGASLSVAQRRLVADQLAAMLRLQADLAASLCADTGRTVDLRTNRGTMRGKVVEVTDIGVRIRQPVAGDGGGGTVTPVIPFAFLAVEEYARRLGTEETAEKDLQRGMVALRGGDAEAAGRFFRSAGEPLGAPLSMALDGKAAEAKEKAAGEALAKLVKETGGFDRQPGRQELIRGIRSRCSAKPSRASHARKLLDEFVREYGRTAVGMAQAPAMREALEFPWPGEEWRVPGVEMEFVWVRQLGIWVGKYEVTNGEYRFREPQHASPPCKTFGLNGDRQPVVCVSFEDACGYAAWLTERERAAGRVSGRTRYRLPTRDEWTAFAQCGDGREFPWGNSWPPPVGKAGNYSGEESVFEDKKLCGYRDEYPVTCDVERSWANPWGLFGVGGNVWEYAAKAAGPVQLIDSWRGGGWDNYNRSALRCSSRVLNHTWTRGVFFGFRLVLDPGIP